MLEKRAISVTGIVGVCVIGVGAEGAVGVGHCNSGCWSLIQSALQERDSIGVVAVGLGTVLLLLLLLLLRWLERCNPSVGWLVVGSVVVGFRQGRRCSKISIGGICQCPATGSTAVGVVCKGAHGNTSAMGCRCWMVSGLDLLALEPLVWFSWR